IQSLLAGKSKLNSLTPDEMAAPIPDFDRSGSQSDLKDRFYRYFQEQCTGMQEQMGQLESYSLIGGERKDAVDHLNAGISRLSTEVADLTGSVPAYDQRIYSQAIKALQDKLQETRSKFEPKPRFQFKTKQKNSSAISINDAAELANQKRLGAPGFRPTLDSSNESSMATTPANLSTPPSEVNSKDTVGDLPSFPKNYNEEMTRGAGPVRKPSFSQATNVNISGHTGLHIILPSSASRATSSGSVTKLSRCIVDMSVPTANGAPFAGLALKNIKHSLIIAGHVAGAAHITGVEDSILVVASRQVRMHDCKNVDVYLHCASRPIIEDCNNVRFCPIPKCHEIVGEAPIANQWDQVDDFKWLKAEHSPNWSILSEELRLTEDVWTTLVPGGPGVGLDDILNKIGIAGR
ncbi:Tubulin-folding cofactor C, partial [Lachnellula suecica]